MIIANKEITIYPARDASSPLVILNSFGDECEAVHEELRKMKTADFTLASIKITDWNSDLSPWAIPPVYKNDEPFTGGADAYLETLTGEIIPAIIAEFDYEPAYIALAGYSLPGPIFSHCTETGSKLCICTTTAGFEISISCRLTETSTGISSLRK